MLIERTNYDAYSTTLIENSKPPSKGGNTRAWHRHVITLSGEYYSFRALGAKKWAYAADTISFEWAWDDTNTFRNVKPETLNVWDKDGKPVVRGERGTKPWRTATTRAPVSRREWRD